jgi:hypothetical protein
MSSVASSSTPRAAKAREMLEWCRHAHRRMTENPTGRDWVLIWAGAIVLLRAVGHTLAKEDAAADAHLKKAQKCWWDNLNNTKPNPAIFWGFIDRDRNKLLKEAELTVGQSTTISLQGLSATAIAAGIGQGLTETRQSSPQHGTRTGQENPSAPPPITIHNYHMNSGHFTGQDPRDLVKDAVEWWETQLTQIEQKALALVKP